MANKHPAKPTLPFQTERPSFWNVARFPRVLPAAGGCSSSAMACLLTGSPVSHRVLTCLLTALPRGAGVETQSCWTPPSTQLNRDLSAKSAVPMRWDSLMSALYLWSTLLSLLPHVRSHQSKAAFGSCIPLGAHKTFHGLFHLHTEMKRRTQRQRQRRKRSQTVQDQCHEQGMAAQPSTLMSSGSQHAVSLFYSFCFGWN